LAAALAHCLNSETTASLRIEPGAVYVRLIDLLANRHAESLLHHPVYASRMSAEEAATRYFDATLARRLMLSGSVLLSVAHRFFVQLCARGAAAPWRTATLKREAGDRGAGHAALGPLAPVRHKLKDIPAETSAGSASPSLRSRFGPLVLRAGDDAVVVPEEMATWDAIACAPSTIQALPRGEEFNRFCGIVIDCLRTANRPVQEILGLGRGLCPFDWLEELSIQQMRALRRFLQCLSANDAPDSEAHWSEAFALAPVPGFKSPLQLWNSPIGRALRHGASRTTVRIDEAPEIADPEDGIELFLNTQQYQDQLRLLLDDGVITAEEQRLLTGLYAGQDLDELEREPPWREWLRERQLTMEELLTGLQTRIECWRSGAGHE
jgi:hypothetical protein